MALQMDSKAHRLCERLRRRSPLDGEAEPRCAGVDHVVGVRPLNIKEACGAGDRIDAPRVPLRRRVGED